MSGLDKNRFRNKTVAFRMSPDEVSKLNARVKVSGLPKGEFMINILLNGQISLSVGKYQSDRLSIELRRLREAMELYMSNDLYEEALCDLKDCKSLLEELLKLTRSNPL